MSLQVCRIKGFGYKFDYENNLFSHIDNKDLESDFIDIVGLHGGYYGFKKENSNKKEDNLKIISDGMNGEYKYVLYISEVSYVENTLGDDFWTREFRNDEWIRKYAKENISILLGTELGEAQEFDFLHYS